MKNPKYKLLEHDCIELDEATLYRIQALRKLRTGVKIGELGGYIQSEANLAQDGEAWVTDDAKVYEQAIVSGNAVVSGKAVVRGNAKVLGEARVGQTANVFGSSTVQDFAEINGNAHAYGASLIRGSATVTGNAHVYDSARVWGNSHIEGHAHLREYALACGSALIGGCVNMYGCAVVHHGNISGYAHVRGHAVVASNRASIADSTEIQTYDGVGPSHGVLTAYRTKARAVELATSDFVGSLDEFRDMVRSKHGETADAPMGWYLLGLANLIEFHFSKLTESLDVKKRAVSLQ
ncbi:hypothetical protein G3A43_07655 [Paraburkholderia aspalathi]|nr:hypothetical protein [Paraburkholderia aspalathi]MBK3780130.1 hypothetical protein [Paraburkholderia aspalathi]